MSIIIDVKRQLEVTSNDWDDILNDIIDRIFSNADTEMNVKYSLVMDYTQYWDGGKKTLYFDHVNIGDCAVTDDDVALVEGREEDYVLYTERGYMKSTAAEFTEAPRVIKAVYNAGYGIGSYPDDIRTALTKQVIHDFRRRKDTGLSSLSYPDGSVSKVTVDEWLPDVQKILNKKKRYHL